MLFVAIISYIKECRTIIVALMLSAVTHSVFLSNISLDKPQVTQKVVMLELLPTPKVAATQISESKPEPPKQIQPKTEPVKKPIKKTVKKQTKIPEKPAEKPKVVPQEEAVAMQETPAEPVEKVPEQIEEVSEEPAAFSDVAAEESEKPSASAGASDTQLTPEAVYINANYEAIRRSFMDELIYPDRAKKMGIEGKGTIMLVIDKDGKVKSVSLFSEFGNRLLDDAALKAGKRVRKVVAPGVDEVRIMIPVTFALY